MKKNNEKITILTIESWKYDIYEILLNWIHFSSSSFNQYMWKFLCIFHISGETFSQQDPRNDTHKNVQEGIFNLITQSDMRIFVLRGIIAHEGWIKNSERISQHAK